MPNHTTKERKIRRKGRTSGSTAPKRSGKKKTATTKLAPFLKRFRK